MLRAAGFLVTCHDYGRNFDPAVHDSTALSRCYDIVIASNVLNVQSTVNALRRCSAQIACTVNPSSGCYALVNYPQSPRKLKATPEIIRSALEEVFRVVGRVPGPNLVWHCEEPIRADALQILTYECPSYTKAEISASNIRPSGVVGGQAIVPRLVLAMEGCQ